MKNKIKIILFLLCTTLLLQANLLNNKTLKELKIFLEIIELNKWEVTINMDSGKIIDTAAYCKSLGSPKKKQAGIAGIFFKCYFDRFRF